jgi:hypothetical protein
MNTAFRRFSLIASLALAAFAAPLVAQDTAKPLFHESFASPESADNWRPKIGVLTQDGPPESPAALKITAETATGSVFVGRKLNVEEFAGRTVTISARIKAAGLSTPPKRYNGVKVQLNILTAEGKRDYPQATIAHAADIPWTEVTFTRAIPAGSTELSLRVGLEKITGSLWITDIKITPAN